MKTVFATLLALGLLAGQASARTVPESRQDSAARAQHVQRTHRLNGTGEVAPRSTFDGRRDSGPTTHFGTEPLSDGIFGTLESNAP